MGISPGWGGFYPVALPFLGPLSRNPLSEKFPPGISREGFAPFFRGDLNTGGRGGPQEGPQKVFTAREGVGEPKTGEETCVFPTGG